MLPKLKYLAFMNFSITLNSAQKFVVFVSLNNALNSLWFIGILNIQYISDANCIKYI